LTNPKLFDAYIGCNARWFADCNCMGNFPFPSMVPKKVLRICSVLPDSTQQ